MNSKSKKIYDSLTEEQKALVQEEHKRAYDFDRKDPLFGLSRAQLSGPNLSRRAVLRLLAASGAALSMPQLVAAAGIATPNAARTAPAASLRAQGSGGELTAGWGGTADILTLDPAQINQVLQFQVASNVLSGLTHINADLVAQGDLASDWTVSDDGLEWTFNLREGVTWHNGDAFTADDVVFTYNRSKDPEQSIHSGNLVNMLNVEALDDLTVKITLGRPQASMLVKTLERSSGRAMTIVNGSAIDELGLEQYGLTPVGTGPFIVTEHQIGQGVVLERFPDYYDPERPKLDKVTIIPISEPESLAAAIETGDIQIIGGNGAPAQLIDRFVANPDLVVDEIVGPGFQAMFVNGWREPFMVTDFDKPLEELLQEDGFKVRMALAKAFDRERFIDRALFGRGRPAFGSINPAMAFFFDIAINDISAQTFDVEAARALLADAGFPDGEGFPTLKLLFNTGNNREAEVISQMYRDNLNIDIELDPKDFSVLIVDANRLEYDLLRLGSGGDFDPDDALVDWATTESRFNGPNRNDEDLVAQFGERPFGYFGEARVDELTAEQAITADLDARKALIQEANQITSDKVAAVFTHHPLDILIWRTEVNFPAESRIPGLVDLDRVTVG